MRPLAGVVRRGVFVASVVAASLLLTAGAFAQPVSNLVKNPGFEETYGDIQAGWKTSGAIQADSGQFHSGRMSVKMEHTARQTSSLSQKLNAAERQYTALAWVKVLHVAGTGARMRIFASNGQTLAESDPLTGDGVWTPLVLSFNPGTAGATVELSLADATGTAWFDDVTVGDAVEMKPLIAACPQAPKRVNLALHKKYTMSPAPTYPYCMDPSDTEKLTDGRYTVGYFWTQKETTVGWSLAFTNYKPLIVVDLGRIEPISGITIDCPGGGQAGVAFPREVSYYVSDDNEKFQPVARLTSRGLKQGGPTWYAHQFLADRLKTRGRYVMIRLDKGNNPFVFADEMEVYRGDFDPVSVKFDTTPQSRTDVLLADYGLRADTFTRGHFPETPHVNWLIPLSGGPVKAILMAYGDHMRDVAEIAQRLDVDYVPISHYSYHSSDALPELMQAQIEQALPTAQVMVVGGFRWETMPKPLIEKIKARVREGMGLVCVSNERGWLKPVEDMIAANRLPDDQGILDRVPVALIPGYAARPSCFELADLGRGRVAFFQPALLARPANSLTMGFSLDDLGDSPNGPVEYSYVALSRLILWAAQRDARKISQFSAKPDTVAVTVGPMENGGTLEIVVRDTSFNPILTKQIPVPTAGGVFRVQPPPGANGAHAVDIWLRDEKGAVVDLASTFYRTTLPTKIETVRLSKPFYAPGEPVEATVVLAGPTDGLRLEARLIDTYDREIAPEQDVAIGAEGHAVVKLPLTNPLTLSAALYVSLYRDDTLMEKRLARVWIDLPEKDDYAFCGWYAWDTQPQAWYGIKLLRELGVDTVVSLASVARAENWAWGNIRHGPENVSRVAPENKDDSLVRVPCLTDPVYRAKTVADIEELARSLRPFGVTEWSMGDESTLALFGTNRDYCTSPTCLAGFREYLKRQYKTLAALNESWGSAFAQWGDVVPATLAGLGKREKLGAWLDHRRFMESVFADYHAMCREAVVRQIPSARVGISGTPDLNSYSGHDWWKLMQGALTHLSGYAGVQADLQRSFARPGTFLTTFLGYDMQDSDEQGARYGPWDLLFHGSNGVNYYTLESDSTNCPLIESDMSMTRKGRWFFEEVRRIKAGFGRLFMAARYERDGIAIHYSPASVHAATATGLWNGSREQDFSSNLSNVCMILRQCHLQYDFVHEEQMAQGRLKEYKVLILPWSSAVSAREAASIREFVQQGGTVIADAYAGVRDDHGKPQAMLDDLFGIRQPLAPPACAAGQLVVKPPAGRTGSRLAKALAAAGPIQVSSGGPVQVTDGVALASVGDAPALIRKETGKGCALFLNCSFSNYAEVRSGGVGGEELEKTVSSQSVTAPIRAFMSALLAASGVAPGITVSAGKGSDSEVEIARWRLGETQLLGVVRSVTGGSVEREDLLPCRLTLAREAHVYESCTGRYLGRVATIEDRLPRGVARVYSALPYRVSGITVVPEGKPAAGRMLKVDLRVETGWLASPSLHVFHLSVTDPHGRECPWYAANVVAEKGTASVGIPFAYSDPSGDWTIKARDVMSGVERTSTISLATR